MKFTRFCNTLDDFYYLLSIFDVIIVMLTLLPNDKTKSCFIFNSLLFYFGMIIVMLTLLPSGVL